ncbi:MAG: hypothetical protein B6I38_07610 [Anaerolineaceae bacterium 4572_5.1]|nr:MAG: hypothetical protein B6I38_07610 [Anaerolineaceae bacterium 4572_5.1]
MPAQLGDHTVRAASTPVRDGKGTPLHFEKIPCEDKMSKEIIHPWQTGATELIKYALGVFQMF